MIKACLTAILLVLLIDNRVDELLFQYGSAKRFAKKEQDLNWVPAQRAFGTGRLYTS